MAEIPILFVTNPNWGVTYPVAPCILVVFDWSRLARDQLATNNFRSRVVKEQLATRQKAAENSREK